MAIAKRKQPKVQRQYLEFGEKTASTAAATHPPVFYQTYPIVVIPADGGTAKFLARDPDGGTIAYTLSTTLTGVAINSSTGVLTGTPQVGAQAGNVTIIATASSGTGLVANFITYVDMAAAP